MKTFRDETEAEAKDETTTRLTKRHKPGIKCASFGTSASTSSLPSVVCLKIQNGVVVQGCDIYIGRKVCHWENTAKNKDVYETGKSCPGGWNLTASKWQNPFKLNKNGDNIDEVLRKYRAHVMSRKDLMNSLPELYGKVIGCWCKKTPEISCHGDVLVELCFRQLKEEEEKREQPKNDETPSPSTK